jgi:hypothetical protein
MKKLTNDEFLSWDGVGKIMVTTSSCAKCKMLFAHSPELKDADFMIYEIDRDDPRICGNIEELAATSVPFTITMQDGVRCASFYPSIEALKSFLKGEEG